MSLKQLMMKIACWSAVCVALLLILMAAVIFSLQTRPVQNILQQRINGMFPGAITWNRLRFSPLGGAIRIDELEIIGPDKKKIAGCNSLEIKLSLQALRRHTFRVKKFHSIGISADIVSDSSGRINIVGAFAENIAKEVKESDSSASFNWNIIADDVQIGITNITFLNQADGMNTGLADFRLSAHGNWDGRKATVDLTVDTGWFSNSSMSLPLSDFSLEGQLVSDSINDLTVKVRSGNSTIDIHGNLNRFPDSPQGTLAGIIRADLSEIDTIFNLGGNFSGSVTMEIAASGSLKNPEATLSFDFSGKKVAGYSVNGIRGSLSLQDMVCSIPAILVSTETGSTTLHADANLGEAFVGGFTDTSRNLNKVSGAVEITAKNIALSSIDTSLPEGIIDLSITAKAKGVQPDSMDGSLALSASVKKLAGKGIPAPLSGVAEVNADISGGRITVKKASVSANTLTIDAAGSVNLLRHSMKLAMNISVPDLAEVTEPLGIKGVKGSLTSSLTAQGPFKKPQAHVKLKGRNLCASAIRIGDVALLSHLNPSGTVMIEELSVQNRDSELLIRGSADLFRKGSFTLSSSPRLALAISSEDILLQNFLDSTRGKITLFAEVSGTPDSLAGGIVLEADSIRTKIQNFRSASLKASILGDSITLEKLMVKIDRKNILTGSGFYTFDKKFAAHLKADDISLRSLEPIKKSGSLDGKISLAVSGNGTVLEPSVSGTAVLTEFTLGDKPMQAFNLAFSLKNDTVGLKAEGLADIEAWLGIKNGGFSANLTFDSTDMTPLWVLVGQKEMAGLIDGRITATGNINQKERIAAETDLVLVDIRYRGLNLVSGRDVRIGYNSGIFSIPGIFLSILDSGRIAVHGSGSIDSVLDIGVDAAIPLTLLEPFVPNLPDLAGMFSLNGTLSGTLEQPSYHLSAEVAGASFTIPGLEQSLHSLNARVIVDTGTLKLDSLKGNIGEGSFRLSGLAEHSRFKPRTLQVQLTCNNLPIAVPETMETLLDGNVRLTGDSSAADIEGEIVVLNGLYYKPVNITGLFTPGEKRRTISPAPDTERRGLLDKTTLDIAVKSRSSFTAENNLASLEIKPDVRIKGTLRKPVISGRGKVESGVIKWQKRDLVISRGVVDFLNPYETQATLDIESQIAIRDWMIQLGITGTAPDDLTLSLSEKNAKPPLNDADIISILATGRTTAELLGGEGGKTKEQLLASLLASEVSKRLQDGTLLDKVEIEAGSEGDPSGTRDIKVTVGKNLSRRLTTLYSFETGTSGIVQRGSAEYKLLERFMLSGFQDTEGSYGGALEWNLQWR